MPNTIADNLQRLVDAKADIASAITAKGGTVTSGDGFEEFPADIATIPSSGGGESLPSPRPSILNVPKFSDSWSQKTWAGLTSFNGRYIWTDGTDIYYSSGSDQYVLDKATSTWSQKTWAGLTSFNGEYIWTDGTDIYYASYSGSDQYVLDKATSTWSQKIWTGLTSFASRYIWTDVTNIYYSSGSDQYVLDKATSTWSQKTWSGLTSFYGARIWTDGTDIYYSSGSDQHVLDKATSTWSQKTWSGLTSFTGSYIWTDGTDIYYSSSITSDIQYVLDKATSTWSQKTWTGFTPPSGIVIWTDGTDIYYSAGSDQYVLDKLPAIALPTTKCVPIRYILDPAFARLVITATEGTLIEATNGTDSFSYTATADTKIVSVNLGTWTITGTLAGDSVTKTVVVDDYNDYATSLAFIKTFGVSWADSSATTMTRTDDAVSFSNPDPYVNDNNHPGSSPFDNVMPWSGIRRVTLDGNELVEIPKFWYKITNTGSAMTFQIANGPVEGFYVSPAHMDRGDGAGERDYVYVGRYHCSSTDYKSTSGSSPKGYISRSAARTGIHNLGSDYWQFDFAMFWTIRLLYLVEFADWDSQKVIGYGCGNASSVVTMGYTDSMPYHTGTMASSRTTYAASTQYRYIEGIWDNVFDWCDGIRFSSSTIYTYLNPSTYSDSSGGTNTGTRATSSNCIRAFGVPSATDYEWALYPSSVTSDSSYSTYVADAYGYASSGAVLYVGGNYNQGRYYGMFYLNGSNDSSHRFIYIGARLQYLPS